MDSSDHNMQQAKPLRLFSLGERTFDPSAVTSEGRNALGMLHAVGAPALRFDDGAEEHWVQGRLQSTEDRPALYVEKSNSCEVQAVSWNGCWFHEQLTLLPNTHVWCEDGFIHRDGAAAVINYGDEDQVFDEWWQHGLRHRDDGPAVRSFHANMWFQRGLMHREEGPALDLVGIACKVDNPDWNSSWFWRGHQMLMQGNFSTHFNYDAVPAEFVLRALAYSYRHSGGANITEDALERASTLMPQIGCLLKDAANMGASGQDIARHIDDCLSGALTSEAYGLDGLLNLD